MGLDTKESGKMTLSMERERNSTQKDGCLKIGIFEEDVLI